MLFPCLFGSLINEVLQFIAGNVVRNIYAIPICDSEQGSK